MACSVATKLWLITPPRWCLITYFSAVTIWSMQFADQVDLSSSQSPEGVGRTIVALAGDPEVMGLTGQALTVTALAARYGVDVSS